MRRETSDLVVLLVEDEIIIRTAIAIEMVDAGWIALEASSAEEAIAILLANEAIDVLVTDIQLGGEKPAGMWPRSAAVCFRRYRSSMRRRMRPIIQGAYRRACFSANRAAPPTS